MKHLTKFIIFCFIGFGSFLLDWLIFNIIYYFLPWFVFSRIISAGLSMIFNFNMNRNLTFSAREYPAKKQIIRWLIIYSISAAANISAGKLTLIVLGESVLNANIAFFVGVIIGIPISFLGSLLWAFKKPPKKDEKVNDKQKDINETNNSQKIYY